jgi:hypothetical protein
MSNIKQRNAFNKAAKKKSSAKKKSKMKPYKKVSKNKQKY